MGARQIRPPPAPTGSVFILPPCELHACGAASADVAYAVLYVEAAVMQQGAKPPHRSRPGRRRSHQCKQRDGQPETGQVWPRGIERDHAALP
ncbi:MAG: hypothetical protein AB3X44_17030 [Leptothrix sp. (in: b-proteobacteria)]